MTMFVIQIVPVSTQLANLANTKMKGEVLVIFTNFSLLYVNGHRSLDSLTYTKTDKT